MMEEGDIGQVATAIAEIEKHYEENDSRETIKSLLKIMDELIKIKWVRMQSLTAYESAQAKAITGKLCQCEDKKEK